MGTGLARLSPPPPGRPATTEIAGGVLPGGGGRGWSRRGAHSAPPRPGRVFATGARPGAPPPNLGVPATGW